MSQRRADVPKFQAVKVVNRAQAVRDQLLESIQSGEFKPGDPMPSERKLGEVFGVSRVSVREALHSLEALGLVEVHHGRGTFVASGPADRYLEPFETWLKVHGAAVQDLLKVRGALDELAAAEAAEHHDAASLADLRAAQSAFAELAGRPGASPQELTELDISFHLAIAKAAASELLLDLSTDLHRQLSESRTAAFLPEERRRSSSTEHAEIVDAIARRDVPGARAAVARHIRATSDLLARLASGADPTVPIPGDR